MSIGILLIRLLLAAILVVHASQKSFGWFQGGGIERMSASFHSLGLRPGRVMVRTASAFEILAAISLALGLATPLGAAAAAGSMCVAGITMTTSVHKLWNAAGGGEYPFVLAVVALAIGVTGPARISLDAVIGSRIAEYSAYANGGWLIGICVAALAAVAVIPFAVVIHRFTSAKS